MSFPIAIDLKKTEFHVGNQSALYFLLPPLAGGGGQRGFEGGERWSCSRHQMTTNTRKGGAEM